MEVVYFERQTTIITKVIWQMTYSMALGLKFCQMALNTKDFSLLVKKGPTALFSLLTVTSTKVKFAKTQFRDMEDSFILTRGSILANFTKIKCTVKEFLIGKTVDCILVVIPRMSNMDMKDFIDL